MEVARRRGRRRNWIGHILRRNCLPKQFIKGKIKGEMEVEVDKEEDATGLVTSYAETAV